MPSESFEAFFERATGKTPYPYQTSLAAGPIESRLISIPTGCGKTAAAILAWLWRRGMDPEHTPRRLVYCLPMRVLVEQTRDCALDWLDRLELLAGEVNREPAANGQRGRIVARSYRWLPTSDGKVGVHVLMGGEEAEAWDLYPEREAILIGTQDMLLSRALNRGYAMSRYRWPMHFGLLNNDCLWVMDETQLMGAGLSTACQLEAFRASASDHRTGFGSSGLAGSVTWYMSATAAPEHLKTREWRDVKRPDHFEFGLSTEEKIASAGPIHQRRRAAKVLQIEREWNFGELAPPSEIVSRILAKHEDMIEKLGGDTELPARTLIICNTVDRAVRVHAAIKERKPARCDVLLLHSRFRPPERKSQMERLIPEALRNFPKGQIVVATQVIEAGVDLSSGILWTEVAPLASLVQRLGRLNRAGEFNASKWKPIAVVVGVGVQAAPQRETKESREKRERDNAKRYLPYELAACEAAWNGLAKLNGDASPAKLEEIKDDIANSIPRCPHSLQRHELTDFFDTDANLSLGFTDVSPFVRGLDQDTDVEILWRESWPEKEGQPDFTPDYQRDEICSIPISKARAAREIVNQGWLWRGKESGWISVRDSEITPGMAILLPLSAGGYTEEAGWTGDPADNKHRSHYQPQAEPQDEDLLSCLENGWRSIAAHTAEVAEELATFINELLPGEGKKVERDALQRAVLWHDVGKNYHTWQQAVLDALANAGIAGKDEHRPFAKFSLSDSPQLVENGQRLTGQALKSKIRSLRRLFRPGVAHEAASALAFRQAEQKRLGAARDTDLPSVLAEYVIMSHHGRVRKVLRDEIPRFPKNEKDTNTVRGVENGGAIPPVMINGETFGCESLSTDCRRMGRDANGHESYTRAVLRLLDRYGPFRLAFFEAVFRAADIRASARASQRQPAQTKP
jgi:CRISPR-associated endonuclease/helicase Cas3